MKKKFVKVESSRLQRLLAKAGLRKISDLRMKALVVTAADGSELTVDREEGEPQVGDTASPDGTFVLDDGTEIIVEDGVITEINAPEDGGAAAEGLDEEELIEKVEELTQENQELVQENEELTQEKEELEEELEAHKKNSRVLSADEKVILAKVQKAGGRQWLDKVLNSKSSFNASNTRFVETTGPGRRTPAKESPTQKALRERREAAAAKRKARNK